MAEEWIDKHPALRALGSEYIYAITRAEDRVLVGAIALRPIADQHENLGYWIGRDYWGNGYATAAARALIALGVQVPGLPAGHGVAPGTQRGIGTRPGKMRLRRNSPRIARRARTQRVALCARSDARRLGACDRRCVNLRQVRDQRLARRVGHRRYHRGVRGMIRADGKRRAALERANALRRQLEAQEMHR